MGREPSPDENGDVQKPHTLRRSHIFRPGVQHQATAKAPSKPFHSVLSSKVCFRGLVSKSFSREGIKAMKLDPASNSVLAVQLANGECGTFDLVSLRSMHQPYVPPPADVSGQ